MGNQDNNENRFASSELTMGQMNAIVKKLGGHDNVLRFLRGELIVSEPTSSWREQDGVIYFSVTSDGTTGEQWITRLENKGFSVHDHAKSILRSPNFKTTSSITYEMAVFKGMFEDRITKNIHFKAKNRRFSVPNAEVACLIREKFSDKELEAMGLSRIVIMHGPIIEDFGGNLVLSVELNGIRFWVTTDYIEPNCNLSRKSGFAFVVSQVKT